MRLEFLLNLLFLLTINFLVKPLYIFGVDLQLQNALGSEAYGLYFALFNFSFLFQIASDGGLQYLVNKHTAEDPSFLQRHGRTLLRAKFVLALLFVGLATAAAWLVGYRAEAAYLLVFLLFNQLCISFTAFCRACISGLQAYRVDSVLSALDKVLMLLFGMLLIYSPLRANLSLEWFAYSQSLAYGLTALVAWAMLRRHWRWAEAENGTWNAIKVWLSKAWPYTVAVLLMTIYTRVDAVLLERLLPAPTNVHEAGVYAFGFRLLDMLNMVGVLFAGLLLPMFARLYAEGLPERLRGLFGLAWALMMLGAVAAIGAVWAHGAALTTWLLAGADTYTVSVLQALVWSFAAGGSIYVCGPLLTACGQISSANKLFLSALLLNIFLNAMLIPHTAALGAAWVALATQGLVALGEGWLAWRFLGKPNLWPQFGRWAVFLVAAAAVWSGSAWLAAWLDWRLCAVLGGGLTLGIGAGLGLLDLRALRAARAAA